MDRKERPIRANPDDSLDGAEREGLDEGEQAVEGGEIRTEGGLGAAVGHTATSLAGSNTGNSEETSEERVQNALVPYVKRGGKWIPKPDPIEYGPDVRRLAYEIWLLRADRNAEQTARLLYDEAQDDLAHFPNAATIRKWAREEQWKLRAEEEIKNVAQFLNERHFLRLFAATETAEEAIIKIVNNTHEEQNPRRLQVIKDAAVELLKLRGLGTAGGYAPPPIPHATVKIGGGNESPQELARQIRDHIAAEKEGMNRGRRQ